MVLLFIYISIHRCD